MRSNTRILQNVASGFAIAALVSACGESRGEPRAVAVRDSAGIQIVENPAEGGWAPGQGWRLSEAPVLSIGQAEGAEPYRFVRIASALRRSDGVIVVADAGQQVIRFFDRSGSFLRAAGGKGKGPGEFEQMASVVHVLPGDSLLAYDLQLQRYSVFGSDGALGRTTPMRWDSKTGFPRPVGVLGDGSILVSIGRVFSPGEAKNGVSRDPVRFLRTSYEGAALDTVATVPGGESYLENGPGGSITVVSVLFGGHSVHAVHGDQVVLGSNASYELGVYSGGALRRIIRREQPPRAVTDAEWDAAVRQQLEKLDGEWRGEMEGMYRRMPRPRVMPFYSAALFDDAGNVWLEDFRAPSDTVSRWTVFEPGGRMLGGVAVPDGFRPTHIGPDFILGVEKDDMDVEYVRQYAIIKDAPAP